jgi:hypothetical protein
VAHPCEARRCRAIDAARGLIPILSARRKDREVAERERIDLGRRDHRRAAQPRRRGKAWSWCATGPAELLMKGSLHTDELLGRRRGARDRACAPGRRLSHVFIMDVPTYHKVLIVTDAAINIAPTLEDKSTSSRTRIDLWRLARGLARPKVAILAAVETLDVEDAATLDAAALCKMAERGQITAPSSTPAAPSTKCDQRRGPRESRAIRSEVFRRSRHPARPVSRSRNILAKQLSYSPTPTAPGPGARRARADHPHEPRRQRALADRELRGRRAGGARTADGHGRIRARPQRGLVEPEVLRLREPAAALGARRARPDRRHRDVAALHGEGRRGARSRDRRSTATVTDGRRRSRRWRRGSAPLRRRARVGVGHRVVHGGAKHAAPVVVTPQVSTICAR